MKDEYKEIKNLTLKIDSLALNIIKLIIVMITLILAFEINTLLGIGLFLIEFLYIKKHLNMKFSKKEFLLKPLLTVITMFVVVKMSYALTFKILASNTLSTLISIMIGGLVYVIVLLAIGGMRKEEILLMPKGEKIYRMLKKLKLMN